MEDPVESVVEASAEKQAEAQIACFLEAEQFWMTLYLLQHWLLTILPECFHYRQVYHDRPRESLIGN